MKNLKKVLALVMAFAMVFTMMATAGAAYTDQADIEATEAVEMLNAIGVMTGDPDGSFRPNDTITRAEACRMIYTIRTNSDNADAYKDMQTTFKDVPSDAWYAGYVKHCQAANIVSGTSATTFEPNRDVTGVELALMCLRVMGYDPAKADIGGSTWSTKTIGLATEAGLLDGVNTTITSACPRQWAAQLMYNTIDANTVQWSTDTNAYSKYFDDGSKRPKVGKEYMKLWVDVGTLVEVSNDNITIYSDKSDVEDSDGFSKNSNNGGVGNHSYTKVPQDYSSLLGQKVKVLYRDGKTNSIIGVYPTGDSTGMTVNASAVESDGSKIKIDGKSYSIESEKNGNDYIDIYYYGVDGTIKNTSDASFTNQAGTTFNKAKTTGSSNAYSSKAFDNWDNSSATMQFVDTDNNGRLDQVFITDYAAAEVTSVTSTKVVAGKSYDVADNNIDEGIVAGDWAVISYDRFNDCTRIAKADVVTGTLNGLKKDSTMADKTTKYNEYQIGDTWYNSAADKDNRTDINTVKAGDDVQAIAVNGAVWMIKRASGDGTLSDVTNVAMVVNKDAGIGGNQVKLQFFNDTTKVVDVDDDSTIKYASLNVGSLYEYSISGEKYSFENLVKTSDYYGDFTYVGEASGYSLGNDTMGKAIDDKAKVILFQKKSANTGNESKVITGKQFKALKAADVGSIVGNPVYFTADVNGLTRTAAIAATVTKLPETTTSNDYYGYILEDAKESGSNEVSYKVLLEGADEAVTVYEKNTKIADRKANTLIGYKSLDGADAEKRYIDDVHKYTLDDVNFGLGAVTDVNSKQTTVQITDVDKTALERDITADTVVFYVDTDDKTGSSTGSIRKATKWYTDADKDGAVQVVAGSDKYVANCLYLTKDIDDMEVLVVETGDNQFRGPYVDEFKGVSFSAEITPIEAGTSTATVNFTTKNIADGSKINLTAKASGASAVTMNAATVASGKVTGTLSNTTDLARGDYELTFTATDASGAELAKTTATLTVGAVSVNTISAPTVTGDLKSNAPAVGKKVNEIVTSVVSGDSELTATGFSVKVTNKAVSDTYALAAGDTVEVRITMEAKDGNVLAPQLNVSNAAIQGAVPTVDNQTSTSVDLVYTYTVPKTALTTLNITGLTAPVKDATPDTELTAPANTKITSVEWQDNSGLKVAGNFAATTQYKVVIVLTADEGYTFGADGNYSQNVTLDAGGNVATKVVSDNGNTLTVTSDLFSATGA